MCGHSHMVPRAKPYPARVLLCRGVVMRWITTCSANVPSICRRLVSAGLTLLIMAAGAGVQYGLAVAGEEERKTR